ncbi:MAG: hypothetical protein JXB39_07245, partial [Deltaproteobacteria bacterium]|nr:hypothetical protein [Deltaproteobacteria bacterium]
MTASLERPARGAGSERGRLRQRIAVLGRRRRGVALDALAAVEPASEPELRRALFDLGTRAWRHADLCRAHAARIGRARASEAGREEAGLLFEHGLVAGRTRWERLGPSSFLAHLCLVGGDTARRLDAGRIAGDPETEALFARVRSEGKADADACCTHLL